MSLQSRAAILLALALTISFSTTAMSAPSEREEMEVQAANAIAKLKAGYPADSAEIIRKMLMNLQLAMIMDPDYSKNPVAVYLKTPAMLREFFGKIIASKNENAETKAIFDSLVKNTVPRDYEAQLTSYCKQVDSAMHQLDEYKTIADCEELKYGDPLTTLCADDAQQKPDSDVSAATLKKLGDKFNQLALQAQDMPVGDARPALGLYRLALVANSSQRYPLAEALARNSLDRIKALNTEMAAAPQIQLALAYALVKQEKFRAYDELKEELLKNFSDRERLLITLARFCELRHDDMSALKIYQIAVVNRANQNNVQKPEWQDSYNAVLQRTKSN